MPGESAFSDFGSFKVTVAIAPWRVTITEPPSFIWFIDGLPPAKSGRFRRKLSGFVPWIYFIVRN